MKKTLLFIILCTHTFYHLQAGGFKIGLQGQKQLGMGHTGVGFAQDAATIYFNPAGMSFVSSQLNGSLFALVPNTSFLDKNTNTITNSVAQVFTPFSVFGQIKLSSRINFGIGAYTPFGSGVLYPSDWTGRYILNKIELQTVFIQPTLSLRLSKHLSLGAGFIYSVGHVEINKDLPIQSNATSYTGNANLYGKAKGVGMNAGLYIKTDKINLGVAYHSKVNMKVDKGQATFTNIPTALASSFPANNTFTSTLALPSELAIGTSFHLSRRTVMALDFNYTYWKSYDSLGFDYAENTSTLTDAKSARLYKNAYAFRAGLQYNASKKTIFRVGAFYDKTPIKDGYVSPELPDNDKIGVSAGLTFNVWERCHIDFSFLYENVKSRTQKNIESGLDGTFKTKAIAPGVGVSYLLQKRKIKIKRY